MIKNSPSLNDEQKQKLFECNKDYLEDLSYFIDTKTLRRPTIWLKEEQSGKSMF